MTLTKEQIELRRGGVSGSDIYKIVEGKSIDVFLEKRGLAHYPQTEQQAWGHVLEPIICDRWHMARRGVGVIPSPTVAHAVRPWQIGTPDRRVIEMRGPGEPVRVDRATIGILEAKARSEHDLHRWGESGAFAPGCMPEAIEAQVRWYMSLVDAPRGYVAVLFGNGQSWREYEIERDPELEGHLLTIGEDFYKRHVVTGLPPSPDGSKAWSEYIRKTFRGREEDLVTATPTIEGACRVLRDLKGVAKVREREIDKLQQELLVVIGDKAGLLLDELDTKGRRLVVRRSVIAAKEITPKPYTRAQSVRLTLPRGWDPAETEE